MMRERTSLYPRYEMVRENNFINAKIEKQCAKEVNYICTLGPNSLDLKILIELYNLGMRYARFNLGHELPYLDEAMKLLQILKNNGYEIKTIFDIPSSEVRIIAENNIALKEGEEIQIGNNLVWCTENIAEVLSENDILTVGDDIKLKVLEIKDNKINCIVLNGGNLKNNHKIWNEKFKMSNTLTEKSKLAIIKAKNYEADYLALSFVNSKENIISVKKFLNDNTKIISKIETKDAVDNLVDIIDNSDAVMIARGDLAVTNSIESLAYLQAKISRTVNILGGNLIIGTGFLESMRHKNNPTRSEVLDLYNAVYTNDADLIMFSSEIAFSKDPVRVLKTANKIING